MVFLPRGEHPSGAAGAVEHRPDRRAALQRVVVLREQNVDPGAAEPAVVQAVAKDRYGVDLTTVERIQGVLHVMVSEGLGAAGALHRTVSEMLAQVDAQTGHVSV